MREVEADTEASPVGFAEFVVSHGPALLRFAWALSGNWATAEDLVQAALGAAWPRWSTLTQSDHPEYYVRRIVVTTSLRWQRRHWRAEIPTLELPQPMPPSDASDAWNNRDALIGFLHRLTPKQRAVIVLSYFLDLSEKDAADTLGCSVGTIKRQKHVALARLRAEPGLAALLRGENV